MKVTNNFGKRIILSLIVVMLLSLVFVSAINEQKIKLDELSSIKKLVLGERDKSFNIVKEKIVRLLSGTTPDDKKSSQLFITALLESRFLTSEQIKTLNDLEQGIVPAAGAQAGRAEEKSTWSGKWIWILLLLLGGAAFIKRGRKMYGFGGRLLKLGFGRFWFVVSGKKGKLEAIERYNKQIAELEDKIKTVITKDILGHLNDKEKLIIANFKDAYQLVFLGQLVIRKVFVKGHALNLLKYDKPVEIEQVGKLNPIKLKEILDKIIDINKNLPNALNQLISNEIAILVQHKNYLQNARQIIVKANAAGARLSDKPVKRLLAAKTTEIDAILNRINEDVKRLEQFKEVLDRTVVTLQKILAEQNEYIKLELGVNDPNDKMYYGGFTELLDIIEKKFGEFANVAQDILDEADKIKDSFARKEKRIYDFITKMVERIKQESDSILEINKTIKLDELNKLIDAARKISYLISKLNQNKAANRNKVMADDFKQFIMHVEQLKNDLPQVTLEEFKEALEEFVIVHENAEFKIIEVTGDEIRLENVTQVITFVQLKDIDNFVDNIMIDEFLNNINRDIATTIVPAAKKGKIAVISDIHSNLQAFEAVLADIKSQGINEIYCCGDIIGYNANPNECVKLIKDNDIQWVLGNHEVAILNKDYAERVGFSPSATAVVNWQITKLNQESKDFLNAQNQTNYTLARDDFMIVHSELTKPEDFRYLYKELYDKSNINFDKLLSDNFSILKKDGKRICFIGHSHIPEIWTIDADNKIVDGDIKKGIVDITNAKNAIVNVGSVGQPRDKNPRACYVIYDKENGTIAVRYVRVEYNIADAQKAIRDRIPDYEENTANYMAERLSKGR